MSGNATAFSQSGGEIRSNPRADGFGGGVYINGSGDFYYTASGSIITGNSQSAGDDIASKDGSHAVTYAVSIDSGIENGTVTADAEKAAEGAAVTVTVYPDEGDGWSNYGYKLMSLTVTAGDEPVSVKSEGDNTYTFIMPAAAVTVSAEFAPLYEIETLVSLYGEQYPGSVDHNCTLEADKTYAAVGETVILTLDMKPGYGLKEIDVTKADYSFFLPDKINDTTYSFVVPENDGTTISVEAIIEARTYSLTSESGMSGGVEFMLEGQIVWEAYYYAVDYGTRIDVRWLRADERELKSMSYSYFVNGNKITTEISFSFDNETGYYEGSFRMPNGNTTVCVSYSEQHSIDEDPDQLQNGLVISDKTRAFAGETVTLTARPDALYALEAWHVTYKDENGNTVTVSCTSASGTENEAAFTMPEGDVTYWAEFRRAYFDIDIGDFIPHGKLTSEPFGYAEAGTLVTLTAVPDEGYEVTVNVWYGETTVECTSEDNNTWTFTMPARDVKADAVFSPAQGWEALQKAFGGGGTITLKYDYAADENDPFLYIPEGKNVTLDLNGHTVDGSALTCRDVLQVMGTLTLKDTADGGKIIGKNSEDTVFIAGGKLTVEGGTVSSENCTYGAVFVGDFCEFTMSGGTLTSTGGEEVLSSVGIVEITGGTITGNGCVDIVYSENGTVTISGGTVEGIPGENGRGILLVHSLLTLSETFTFDFGEGIDVFLTSGSMIEVETWPENGLDSNIQFTVSAEKCGVFAEAVAGMLEEEHLKHFISGDENVGIRLNGEGKAEMYRKIGITSWNELAAAMFYGGDYVLGKDIEAPENSDYIGVPSDVSFMLDLNGHTVDCTLVGNSYDCAIVIDGTMTLTNSGNGGEIVAWNRSTPFDSLVYVQDGSFIMNGGKLESWSGKYIVHVCGGGTFTMNEGTIEDDGCSATVLVSKGADFTMNGGSINGAADIYGSVYSNFGSSFTMNGGRIRGSGSQWVVFAGGDVKIVSGTVESGYGCALRVAESGEKHGTATLTGGRIIGNVSGPSAVRVASKAVLNLSGAPEIRGSSDIYLAEGTAIRITDELTCEEKYVLSAAPGVFAQGTDHTLTESDAACFTSDGYDIILDTENNKLKLEPLPSDWSELQEILADVSENGTVKLEKDYTANGADTPLGIQNKTFTLDLNGHTIDGSVLKNYVVMLNGGTLTVKDSGNGGEIRGKGGNYTVNVKCGSLVLESGTVSGGNTNYGVIYV